MAAYRRPWLLAALIGCLGILAPSAQAACPWVNPVACPVVKNVIKVAPPAGCAADATTIQGGIGLLPVNLAGNECAVVRDTQTYNEGVSFQGFVNNGYQVELLLDPSLSSGPIVTSSFTVQNASVTIGGGLLIQPVSPVSWGIKVSSPNVTISSVSVVDTVTCFNGVPNQPCISTGVALSNGGVVSVSTVSTVNLGLYVNGANNLISGSFLTSAYFDSLAVLNTVSLSTITSSTASAVVVFNGASTNTISQSYIGNSGTGDGIDFTQAVNPAAYNTISYSTVVAGAATGGGAVYMHACSSNTISNSIILSSQNNGLQIWGGGFNQVSQSTVTGTGAASYGIFLTNGTTNDTIAQSVLNAVNGSAGAASLDIGKGFYASVTGSSLNGGIALLISGVSSSNTVSGCTLTPGVTGGPGVELSGTGSGNVLANDFVYTSISNTAVWFNGNGFSVVSSTIVNSNAGASRIGVNITGATDTVASCYIAAPDPVWINGAANASIAGDFIMSTRASENAVYATLANGLAITSSTISGGAQGAGIFLDVGNSGALVLSTNTIQPGSQYGIFVATQSAGTAVSIASNTVYGTLASANSTYGIYLDGLATGAAIYDNGLYYRKPGGAGGNSYYGLYARSSQGLSIQHNRIDNPGMVTAGAFIGVGLAATTNTVFKFNDVSSTGTALASAFLVQVVQNSNGTQLRDNVFLSSVAVSGSSATLSVDAASQSGFSSDYNDWFSASSANTFLWGATAYQGLTAWQGSGNDLHSISSNPLWYNASAGIEDFHPQSNSARCVAPVGDYGSPCASWAIDGVQSPTIDAADPAEPYLLEPSPNGGRANQGSTGDTLQASGPGFATSVTAITPPASASVAVSTSINVFFSKSMSTTTLSAVTLTAILDNQGNTINQLVAGTTSYNQAAKEFILVPSAPLSKAYTYAVQVPVTVKDSGGNPLAAVASSTFTTFFDHTVANAVPGGQGVTFTVPANAFASDGALSAQTTASNASVQAATQKLLAMDSFANPIALYVLTATDASGNPMQPSLPVSVSVPFSAISKPGFVDNTSPPVRVGTLALWWLDPTTSSWVRLPNASVNSLASQLIATTPHFSTFGLIGARDASLSSAFAFPVPYVPANQSARVITFQNLSSTGRIRIFTIDGKLVREIDFNDGSGQATWDARNSAGQDAASGLYLYLIESGGDTKKGELIIVR